MEKKERKYSLSQIDEDATKYGEFISSYFRWRTLEEQKEIVSDLENITRQQWLLKGKVKK